MSSSPAVCIDGLSKSYGRRLVLQDLSFEVHRGEIFMLLGPNGAGKTTTLEIIEGYRSPDAGRVRVLGEDPKHRSVKKRIGLSLQEGGLYPGIRVGEAIGLFASYYPDPAAVAEVAASVGIEQLTRAKVRTLSGGEKARLNLALALVGNPDVLLLDEPTASMDPSQTDTVWKLLRDLADRGVALLITTHAIAEAEAVADRIGILATGTMQLIGTTEELTRTQPAIEITTDLPPDDHHLVEIEAVLGCTITSRGSNRYSVPVDPTPESIRSLTHALTAHGITIVELKRGHRSLRDVYLGITNG